jgi:hypothetical protein
MTLSVNGDGKSDVPPVLQKDLAARRGKALDDKPNHLATSKYILIKIADEMKGKAQLGHIRARPLGSRNTRMRRHHPTTVAQPMKTKPGVKLGELGAWPNRAM